MKRFPITKKGFDRMEAELRELKSVKRPRITAAIAEARAHGDLSENAEYHAAREQQSLNEGRINELEDKVSRSEIIDVSKLSGNNITFGATVKVVDDNDKELEYQIVSEYETDIQNGKISITSPIARGLIGKSVEDYVEITTPKGVIGYEILNIRFE